VRRGRLYGKGTEELPLRRSSAMRRAAASLLALLLALPAGDVGGASSAGTIQGVVRLEAGSCVHQPPGIRHREIGHSEDIEMLEIVLPADVVVAREFKAGAASEVVAADACPADAMILDAGPRAVEDIKLPDGARIITLVRGSQVIMAHHDTVIETDDHVILFLADRRHVEQVERLFQS